MNAHSQFSPMIPDLPVGAVIKRVGPARPGDYEFMGNKIVKTSPRSSAQVIVEAAPGYVFQFKVETNSYIPVSVGAQKTVAVTFDVTKPEHAAFVASLNTHPAFVSADQKAGPTVIDALKGSQIQILKELPSADATHTESEPGPNGSVQGTPTTV